MSSEEKSSLRGRFWRSYISSVISISLVLFIVGLLAMLFFCARAVSAYFKESVQISVVLADNVSESQARQLTENIGKMPQVRKAMLVSKEKGAEQMRKELGEDFLDLFDSNPIPACIDLTIRDGYFDVNSIADLKNSLCENPMVKMVDYQEDMISAINSRLKMAGLGIAFFAALLTLISIVLINNTVRLNIMSRRFAVRTMLLVGATRGFIRRPFMLNSVLQGAFGGILATAGLCAVGYAAVSKIPQLGHIAGWETLLYCGAGLIVLGVLLCVVCTYLVVRKVTDMSLDKLYL